MFNTKIKNILIGTILILLFLITPTYAAKIETGNYTLNKEEIIEDDLYVSGGNITISGIVDGDLLISVIAKNFHKKGLLNSNKVVTTVQSNMGFEKHLDENGIGLIRANVGDRYVLEKMKEHGLNLGGEQSGHIIMLDYNTTGDGILSSIQLVAAIKESGKSLSELVKDIKLWPQKLVNTVVSKEKKQTWSENKELMDFVKNKEKEIEGKGRILVRASGTEPLIRVMVEAETQEVVDEYVDVLVKKVQELLG